MSYKLEKPYTDKEYADFVVEHNHNNGRKIEDTPTAVYSLEPDEMLDDSGVPVINPNYEANEAERIRQSRLAGIKTELYELDSKRIRAMCEQSVRDDGQSWLDYYNKHAQVLRNKLQTLGE